MQQNSKIYVAGHTGLVGSALIKELVKQGYTNIITATHHEVDLRNQEKVNAFFQRHKPEFVFLAAAKVGGIWANNSYPANFIYDNVMIATNIIHAAYQHGVTKLLFLGSSCIYPRECPQPIKEEYLLSGYLEKTNQPYAVAKIAGIEMCQAYNRQYGTNFIACMPTNLYGPGDTFDVEKSHVIPALITKFHQAKINHELMVKVWGNGTPCREFLFVDDLAQALIFLMNNYDGSDIINVGTGIDVTIKELALLIKDVVGFEGDIIFDPTKPDGTPRKLLSVTRLNNLGWHAQVALRDGLEKTYEWYKLLKDS